MIVINNLKKKFGSLSVLEDINLTIETGRIYGLVGRSGAGKSTLLRCINGLETYDEGSLLVDGIEVKSLKYEEAREFKKDIGMIFQQFSLLSRMNVYENISFPMKCWKYPKNKIDKRVRELAEIVGISDKLNFKPSQLSGGQKQRVAIARALSMDPKILLCDEATSALDPKTAKSIVSLLNQINRQLGITIVMVTHQMSVLKSSCEEISILENGKIAESGLVEDIFLKQPRALINLIGDKDNVIFSKGVNIKILLSKNIYDKPIITKMSRELQIDFIIADGKLEKYKDSVMGSVIVNVSENDSSKVMKYLDSNNVKWSLYNSIESECEISEEEDATYA
ncbi:ATP-binding cassette domain-containing protein [Clostridium aciditolerans]|uniref:Methionine ABC transporter ATP-binding protein n=1 Tax=Clostridium aciditolerans TaxID=339861 RepID=A0A934M2U8_9CLOT|nr:methionine ABC transporter ATP-binding protein [Clostridium aciditolerans]